MSAGRAEMGKLIKKVEKAGFTVTRTGGKHWRVQAPDGKSTTLAFSPSTVGPKTMQRLKKIGYQP